MVRLILDEEFNVLSVETETWLIEPIYKSLSLKSTSLWVLHPMLLVLDPEFMPDG